jgi:tRNA-dihydrouridine synthase A
MRAAVGVPVTVKCRIGVDEQEPRDALFALVERVAAAGAAGVVVHARKAWLDGLSPKDNRTIPPLDYPLVYALSRAYPGLPVALNGGLADLEAAKAALAHVEGVMFGRAAYQNPELLLDVDPLLFGEPAPQPDAFAAVEAFERYVARQLEAGARLHDITRHMLGLFAGRPGARLYRRCLATEAVRRDAGLETLRRAVGFVGREALAQAG